MKNIAHYLILLNVFFGSKNGIAVVSADSSCGEWTSYKDEKCFKVFEELGLHTYDESLKACQQKENGSSLITIGGLEEQTCIVNLIASLGIANDVWLGAQYGSSGFKWIDSSSLSYANWATGSPSNRSDHCAQINTDDISFGKWSDPACTRKNVVMCQRVRELSVSELRKMVLDLRENLIPVGLTYVQLPNERPPAELWPWMTWKDITAAYAGNFFRAEGGGSAAFGSAQEENSPRLTGINTIYLSSNSGYDVGATAQMNITAGVTSKTVISGSFNHDDPQIAYTYYVSGGEVRPRNMAIRVWKRAA